MLFSVKVLTKRSSFDKYGTMAVTSHLHAVEVEGENARDEAQEGHDRRLSDAMEQLSDEDRERRVQAAMRALIQPRDFEDEQTPLDKTAVRTHAASF